MENNIANAEGLEEIKLTQYSRGTGCGCKIAPKVLDEILKTNIEMPISLVVDVTDNPDSLVAKISMDDAQTVYDGILEYVKSVFMVNTALKYLKLDNYNSDNLIQAIKQTSSPSNDFMISLMENF